MFKTREKLDKRQRRCQGVQKKQRLSLENEEKNVLT